MNTQSTLLTSFLDYVSKFVAVLQVLPFVCYLLTYNLQYLKIQVGWFIISWSVDMVKLLLVKWFPKDLAFRRPGGEHCGMFNESNRSDAPAFPSGHLSTATYIILALWLQLVKDGYIQSTRSKIAILSIYIGLLSVSRWQKKCHTVPQILTGIIYGGLAAMFINKIQV